MKRLAGVTLALLAAGAVLAGDPDAYGYRWPLALDPDAGALHLTLTPEVYAHLYDAGLRDLEVVDAAGKPQPFGPVAGRESEIVPQIAVSRDLPWFALPARAPGDAGGAIRLRVERTAAGELRALDASVPPNAASPERRDVLVDLTGSAGRVESLDLAWTSDEDISARFRVSASDDLVSWRSLVSQASVIELHQNGFELVRRRIDLPATSSPYLLLERIDSGPALALEHVRARLASQTVRTPLTWIPAEPLEGSPPEGSPKGVHPFRAPGPLPVERVDLDLARPGSVARVTILSRDREDAPWVLRASLHAFRLGGASEAKHEDVVIPATRDRLWQVTSDPALDAAPTLRLGFRPDEFVLLASGPGPFALLGGSATARRESYPVDVLVAELRSRRGGDWQLSEASLGARETLRGEDALTPPRPPLPLERWALWAVLVAGAGLIVIFSLRLVRSAPSVRPPGS